MTFIEVQRKEQGRFMIKIGMTLHTLANIIVISSVLLYPLILWKAVFLVCYIPLNVVSGACLYAVRGVVQTLQGSPSEAIEK